MQTPPSGPLPVVPQTEEGSSEDELEDEDDISDSQISEKCDGDVAKEQ